MARNHRRFDQDFREGAVQPVAQDLGIHLTHCASTADRPGA
ncbi:hypothetical protein [Actinomadura macrotermitis]|uniref:Uncharacterized protein n=1 Tax=Actinomadura macrotermitis TaxID=2585200 RepID=A0A7K0BTG9_9ACTN|nr:hypothetical protein [Actinomadura macrotermitis]MQY04336.1 hypothetical protein [Actinomadura macrotermitis]